MNTDFEISRVYCILMWVIYRRVLFEDPDFPADSRSLQIRYKSSVGAIEWKRPHVCMNVNLEMKSETLEHVTVSPAN